MSFAERKMGKAIQQELDPILRRIEKANAILGRLKQSKVGLEAALKALTDHETKSKKRNRKPPKPCATKEEVMKVCTSIAALKPALNKPDFESKVKAKLSSELGYSLSGVQLRLRECLASRRIQISEEGLVSLNPKVEAKLRERQSERKTASTTGESTDSTD